MIAGKLAQTLLEVEELFAGQEGIFMQIERPQTGVKFSFYTKESDMVASVNVIDKGWGSEQDVQIWLRLDKITAIKKADKIKEVINSRFANLETK